MQRGFELARDEINRSGQLGDAKITFITQDDQDTVEDAVEAYHKLIHQDGVSVILGPANSSQVRETFPIAQQNQVVAISSLSSVFISKCMDRLTIISVFDVPICT